MAGSPLQAFVLCYEVGYDGFWLARLLIGRGIVRLCLIQRA